MLYALAFNRVIFRADRPVVVEQEEIIDIHGRFVVGCLKIVFLSYLGRDVLSSI
jgi:hypothetical protein